MDRITVNLPDSVGAQIRALAETDLRSVSDYAGILLRRNLEIGAADIYAAAAELRALGLDPVIVLRDALAEVERDNALRPNPAA